MHMLDRIKKTVTSVIGNPVCREYDLGCQIATFGPGLLWKVYDAKKKSTGQEVSVFVFEKKILEKMEKRTSDLLLEAMKAGATNLARLRHPRLLVVQHPLEESRDSLAFATEPVFASLVNILGNHKNISTVPKELKDYELYDVEKVYGLYQVIEGLTFLHNDAKRLHGNLTTESVVITKSGQWKIAGLHFSKAAMPSDVGVNELVFECRGWDSQLNPLCQPELNYTAPEHVLSRTCNTSTDLFSLGVLVYALYNNGVSLFECQGDIVTYKKQIEKLSRSPPTLGNIPAEFQRQVQSLLSISPEQRPDVHQISKATYFDNVAAQTLHYIDTLMQRDNMTKSQFFKSLYKIISMLPKRVVIQRVLPDLCSEFTNHAMVPFVLPNVLLIAEHCTDEEYRDLIFPKLKPVLKIQEPMQVVLILLKKMDLLLTKTSKEDIQLHVLPMVFQSLEATSEQVQELSLNIIPSFAKMIEYTVMKHSIIPRIKTLCLRTNSFSVRVNCLVCLGKVLEFLDKFLIVDEILSFLPEIPTRDPAICMAILGIYKQTMIHKKISLDKNYIATKALPFLLPLSVEHGLNITQFNQFMSVIRDLVTRVETEQKAKLEQLKKMQEETKSSLSFAQEVQQSKEIDDLMGKVGNLFAGNTMATSKEKPQPEQKTVSNESTAFNKFFGFNDPNELSKNAQDLANFTPKSEKTEKVKAQDPFGPVLATTSKTTATTTNLDPTSSHTLSTTTCNTATPYTPMGFNQRSYHGNTSAYPQPGFQSSNLGSQNVKIGGYNNMQGNFQGYVTTQSMTSRHPGTPTPHVTMTSMPAANNMASLNALAIPGFSQPQSQPRTLNQMTPTPPRQPLNNAGIISQVTPSNTKTSVNNADLLDIFG